MLESNCVYDIRKYIINWTEQNTTNSFDILPNIFLSEILAKIRKPPPLLRPSVSPQAAQPQYIHLMKECWSENPDLRPTVEEIYQQYKHIQGGK